MSGPLLSLILRHVFEAARRAKTVKKIVMTSSVAAIYHAAKEGKVHARTSSFVCVCGCVFVMLCV